LVDRVQETGDRREKLGLSPVSREETRRGENVSSQLATVWVVDVMDQAEAGVDYTSRHGARCPACGTRAKIYKTMPWIDAVRVRYHRCYERGCVLASTGKTIKSVEEG